MHRKREKSDYIVHNVDLAFDILFYIARKQSVKTKDLEEKFNVSPTTLEKILETLVIRGYLDFNKRKKLYTLGIKNFELGHSYLSHSEIRRQARPFLQKLSEEFQENVYLATRSGFEIVYIDVYEVERNVVVKSRVGRLLPMYASASGKVHLAFMEKEEIEEFFREVKLERFTENTITDKNLLLKELEEVRKKGYAIDNEEWEKEVRCLSVPVRDYTGDVVAALTLSAPAFRLSFNLLHGKMKDSFLKASEELSEKLGYSKEIQL
ncbi:IclR family transcriptional regulator [Sulfurihydrogenibium azorense]|jgi:DNA-binding IclR family transcriptional regulator|uniref:Transcriptional regulator n=1 Tax=Sulfurihydrogenibium azorense (strain DSM 15241 / OCM 825 / Az-Fu1) TaxID=204536 RepID=C1DUH8_SULAA|nr:IclR family transcriptional regulator [Sulfurihydrogenibium azorense]ACN98579.1 transcriptional regulator [Sulfurihydrogenibium azorense Az-Fu1]MDM7274473.1 IclR family transcriptional regulator [Sulfurihydrogenibium azorense]